MLTVLLLVISNTFMTFAWYGHLKYRSAPIVAAILVSWLIALGEYCFQVPANRLGYGEFSGYQLKIIQESVTLVVFAAFVLVSGRVTPLELHRVVRLHYGGGGLCLLGQAVTRMSQYLHGAAGYVSARSATMGSTRDARRAGR